MIIRKGGGEFRWTQIYDSDPHRGRGEKNKPRVGRWSDESKRKFASF